MAIATSSLKVLRRPLEPKHDLSIAKQAEALGISRGRVYDLPRPVLAADLAIMRRIDELHLEFPFAGSRMLRDLLKQEGIDIGRRHVSTLMKRMGLEALYRKPNTSKPAPGHKIYPYLLRHRQPDRLWSRQGTEGRSHEGLCPSGHAGDLGP